jgi:hypothetical protein
VRHRRRISKHTKGVAILVATKTMKWQYVSSRFLLCLLCSGAWGHARAVVVAMDPKETLTLRRS